MGQVIQKTFRTGKVSEKVKPFSISQTGMAQEVALAFDPWPSPGGRNPLCRHEALVGGDCVPEIFRYRPNLVDFV